MMARQPRFNIADVTQHVIQRGNNRQPIFFADADYARYREILATAAKRHACAVHAYVLMPNHVHLLVTPRRPASVAKLMQSLGGRYVRYVNQTHGRTGTLWEGRYRSSLVDGERYLLACLRYIELNPVRAMIVSNPADYRWSSHRHHARGEADALITEHPLYDALGPTPEARRAAYRALFETALDEGLLSSIRNALNQGRAVAGPLFLADMESRLQRSLAPAGRGRPRRAT